MSDKYKTYDKLKEELGNNYDLFMYEINLCLLQKIDKATEYINDRFTYDKDTGGYHLTHTFDGDNVFELLNILQGESKGESNE